MRRQNSFFTVFTIVLAALLLHSSLVQAEPSRRRATSSRPITNPKFDPSAEKVELFSAMESGQIETKVIATGPEHGNLLIKNTTDQPLTVQMPQAFVTVHVLKQMGGMMGGMGGGMGGMGGGMGGMGGGMGGMGGGMQNQGGGMGGMGGGMGGMGGGMGGMGGGMGGMGGGGFMSIPPERIVRVPYVSACLNHGKADPVPQATYQLVSVDAYTQDPVLKELITMVATGRLAAQAAQAAVWNRTDNMSWQELAVKVVHGPAGQKSPYFTANDLRGAQLITSTAIAQIRERGEDPEPKSEPVAASRVRGAR